MASYTSRVPGSFVSLYIGDQALSRQSHVVNCGDDGDGVPDNDPFISDPPVDLVTCATRWSVTRC